MNYKIALMNIFGSTKIILFELGKPSTPVLILDDYEFEMLIASYKKQKKELET